MTETAAAEAPDETMPGAGTDLEVARRAAPPTLQTVLSDDEIRRTWRVSCALAQSGMFKDAKQAEQAFAKVLIGRDLGLTPAQAMTGIHIVEGKPELAAVMLANFVRSREGYDYLVTEHTAEACSIEFVCDGVVRGTSTFTMADAEAAGLAKKGNYEKWPRNMLFARAMSNGVKWYVPEVMAGVPVYHEGELEARAALGAGDGDGEAAGIDLGPKVEAVLERARALGHVGLSDRATAEMTLGGRSPADADRWVEEATAALDRMEAEAAEAEPSTPEHPADPPEVEPERPEPDQPEGEPLSDDAPGVPEGVARMRERASQLDAEAAVARDSGDEDRAAELDAEAESLRDSADAAGAPGQSDLGV